MYIELTCGLLSLIAHLVCASIPILHLYNGHIPIEHPPTNTPIQQFVVGQPYTFEILYGKCLKQDYIVQSCSMNGRSFIDSHGCVLCGDGILTSIETEQYAREGAAKRTLVHFIAKQPTVNLVCNIRVLDCSGCAERSCERHPVLAMLPGVSHSLVYPVVVVKDHIFLYALCLLPLLLLLRRRKRIKSVADVKKRGIGVETDKAEMKETAVGCRNVHQYAADVEGIHRITPAVALGERESIIRSAEMHTRDERLFRRQIDLYDSGSPCDRASYRNFAYERDMGRVAPVEGYDEVQTRERRFYRSGNEDNDLVEKDVERTHKSTFAQETRHIVDDEVNSVGERYREEDVQHAIYSHEVRLPLTTFTHKYTPDTLARLPPRS
ncbi:hypothetical protein KIN20_010787 [Parelaphostrongylus tenuis]|uniref:Uncharacterized protein n=1 Tax=Parelaphostrongylus tenuis TaxID=148309 RepID=A0AAD5MSF3_PARTN|nr:hypothetical protein KIN20_010787 [Parelaphostrongylus tenuis]